MPRFPSVSLHDGRHGYNHRVLRSALAAVFENERNGVHLRELRRMTYPIENDQERPGRDACRRALGDRADPSSRSAALGHSRQVVLWHEPGVDPLALPA